MSDDYVFIVTTSITNIKEYPQFFKFFGLVLECKKIYYGRHRAFPHEELSDPGEDSSDEEGVKLQFDDFPFLQPRNVSGMVLGDHVNWILSSGAYDDNW